jgi:hypothetical protein
MLSGTDAYNDASIQLEEQYLRKYPRYGQTEIYAGHKLEEIAKVVSFTVRKKDPEQACISLRLEQ